MINLKDFPKSSGVYWIVSNEEIIYVGSSKNLYHRMSGHNSCIKKGGDHDGTSKQDFYQFLQNNSFTVEFQLADKYRQLEQELIELHNPKFNSHRAYAGCGTRKGRVVEYHKDLYQKYKEEIKQYYESRKEEKKQYYESHKEEKKQYQKQHQNQLCSYNGETLTLGALVWRFRKQGIEHPTKEAKKYLI